MAIITRELKSGQSALVLLCSRIVGMILLVFHVLLVPRFLHPEGMGIYSYWQAVFIVIFSIFSLGAFQILFRFVPELLRNSSEEIKSLIYRLIVLKVPLLIVILLVGWVFFQAEYLYFSLIAVGSGLFSLGMIYQGLLYARKRMILIGLMDVGRIGLKLFFVLVLFALMGQFGIIITFPLVQLLLLLFFFPFFIRLIPLGAKKLQGSLWNYLSFGGWIYLGTMLSIWADRYVLIIAKEYLDGIATLGLLGLALEIIFLLYNVLKSLTDSAIPYMVEDYLATTSFQKRAENNWRHLNIAVFLILGLLWVGAEKAIVAFIGAEYIASSRMLLLLLPSLLLMVWSYYYQQILFVLKEKRRIFWANLAKAIVLLVVSFFALRRAGLNGAILALNTANFSAMLFSFAFARKAIEGFFPHFMCCFKCITVTLISFGPLYYWSPECFLTFGSFSVMSVGFFIILSWLIGLINSHDLRQMKALFPQFSPQAGGS